MIIFIVLLLARLATNCLLLSYFLNMLFLFSLSYVNVLSFLISFPHDLLMQDELLRILGIRLFCHIDSLLRPLNNNKICCHFIHDSTFLTIFVLLLSLLLHFSFEFHPKIYLAKQFVPLHKIYCQSLNSN